MAGKFTVIPSNTFDALQLEAGVLLKNFDPSNPVAPADADIICATTGGITATCAPTFSDLGEDVDNVPLNMMELKHLDTWECSLGFTSLSNNPEGIKMALGCADIDSATSAIVPRADLKQTDFSDLWWVGDKANGGFVAIQLKNALSTGGFALTTTKNGKGQIAVTITGHVSINAQKEVPMTFYSIDSDAEPEPTTPSITLDKSEATVTVNDTVTLTATTVPDDAEITWSSSDDTVATVSDGVVSGLVAGTVTITASITVDETDYTATCAVTVESGI